jgi:hypothetical protein
MFVEIDRLDGLQDEEDALTFRRIEFLCDSLLELFSDSSFRGINAESLIGNRPKRIGFGAMLLSAAILHTGHGPGWVADQANIKAIIEIFRSTPISNFIPSDLIRATLIQSSVAAQAALVDIGRGLAPRSAPIIGIGARRLCIDPRCVQDASGQS